MSNGKKNPTGAGAIIALLILGGAIVGGFMGQPSAGLLAGAALGGVVAARRSRPGRPASSSGV